MKIVNDFKINLLAIKLISESVNAALYEHFAEEQDSGSAADRAAAQPKIPLLLALGLYAVTHSASCQAFVID